MTEFKSNRGETFVVGDKCYVRVNPHLVPYWRRARVDEISKVGGHPICYVLIKGGRSGVGTNDIRRDKPQ